MNELTPERRAEMKQALQGVVSRHSDKNGIDFVEEILALLNALDAAEARIEELDRAITTLDRAITTRDGLLGSLLETLDAAEARIAQLEAEAKGKEGG